MENEIMATENEVYEIEESETASSGNGLKTVGVLTLVAAAGAGLFFGTKKLIKKIKSKKADKYVEVSSVDEILEEPEKDSAKK